MIEEYRIDVEGSIYAGDVFKDLDKKYSKVGNILAGYRLREGLIQVQLSKKVKSSQSAIAAIENGSRKVGKTLAVKLAKIFKANYQSFMDSEQNCVIFSM